MNSRQIRDLFEHLAGFFAEEARTPYLDPEAREAAEAALEEDVSALLAEIGAEVPEHIEALGHVRARALTEEAHAAGYVRQWTARKRAARRTVERCEALMLDEMRQLAAAGLTEIARGKSKTPFILAGPFRVSLAKKAPALVVAEGAVWPDEWLVPQDPRPDRSTALKAVKAGAAPDGFGLTEPTTRLAIK